MKSVTRIYILCRTQLFKTFERFRAWTCHLPCLSPQNGPPTLWRLCMRLQSPISRQSLRTVRWWPCMPTELKFRSRTYIWFYTSGVTSHLADQSLQNSQAFCVEPDSKLILDSDYRSRFHHSDFPSWSWPDRLKNFIQIYFFWVTTNPLIVTPRTTNASLLYPSFDDMVHLVCSHDISEIQCFGFFCCVCEGFLLVYFVHQYLMFRSLVFKCLPHRLSSSPLYSV